MSAPQNQPPKPPESYYSPQRLGFIFAIVALILLFSLFGLVLKDYSREWKDYQESFRELEVEKTRVKYDRAEKDLSKNSDYQALLEELKKEKESYQTACSGVKAGEKEIQALQAKDDLLNQKYKFAKTELDVARFQFEAATEHKSKDVAALQKHFQDLDSKVSKLKIEVENSADAIKLKTDLANQCGAKLKELTKKENNFAKQETILKRKLAKIDPYEMSFVNRIAGGVRDLPIIDLSNPSYKIEQIVLKDITEDVNFLQIPKVDRCITCHKGIDNPDYKNAPQPFRTHPNLELYLGKNSPHSMEEFGCTVCHQGRGRGTSFNTTAHTPSSEEQRKLWEKKYHWHEMHHWDEPMLPKQFTEASCFKCHSGETVIKGAEKLNLGMQLIERAGCYGCHFIEKYKNWPKTGPDLTHLASKTTKDWSYVWIKAPQSIRHNTWMPAFFGQSNNSDSESVKRTDQEIHAMVEYLFNVSTPFKADSLPVKGNAKNGEELVSSLGCFACHQVQPTRTQENITNQTLRQEQGPNLIGLGNKTSKEWIFNWIKDPSRYHPETKMPNLRLTDQEASDIAEYLSKDESKLNFKNIAAINEKIVSDITLDFLTKTHNLKEAQEKLSKMSLNEKLVFSGEKLIGHYGCFACHKIKGFENAKPIGAELTEEGSKPADKLDFGFIDIEHSKEAWFHQKLKDPRIFDKGKVRLPTDKLIMPNFYLEDDKVEAITTALLGFVKDKTVINKKRSRTIENQYVEEGQKIIRQLNCQGCHIIEGEGGSIQKDIKEWLVKFDGHSAEEADKLLQNSSPPDLHGLGKKARPDWLFAFLHDPTTTPVRPWLKTRMPTYKFNAEHLNILIKYFNALDKENFPFMDTVDTSMSDKEYAIGEDLFAKLDCVKCHVVGNQEPTGTKDTWAPNLMVAKKKLKPNWIIEWIHNPSKLLPGTKMPAFLDSPEAGPPDVLDGDENAQIQVLRNYLMNLSGPSAPPAQPAPAPTSAEPQAQAPASPAAEENSKPASEEAPSPAQ